MYAVEVPINPSTKNSLIIEWSLLILPIYVYVSACSFNSFLLRGITFKNRVRILCTQLDSRSKTVSASCAYCFCSLSCELFTSHCLRNHHLWCQRPMQPCLGSTGWEPLRALSLHQRHWTSPSNCSAWSPHPPWGFVPHLSLDASDRLPHLISSTRILSQIGSNHMQPLVFGHLVAFDQKIFGHVLKQREGEGHLTVPRQHDHEIATDGIHFKEDHIGNQAFTLNVSTTLSLGAILIRISLPLRLCCITRNFTWLCRNVGDSNSYILVYVHLSIPPPRSDKKIWGATKLRSNVDQSVNLGVGHRNPLLWQCTTKARAYVGIVIHVLLAALRAIMSWRSAFAMRNFLLRKSFFDPLKSHRCSMFFQKTVKTIWNAR